MPRKKPQPPAAESIVLPDPPKDCPHLFAAPSPLVRQWTEAKGRHPDMILLFRTGEYWTGLDTDATVLTALLQLGPAYQGVDGVTMTAFFPLRMLEYAVGKLLAAGHKVALLEPVKE